MLAVLGALLFGAVVGWASISVASVIRVGFLVVVATALAVAFIEGQRLGLLMAALGAAIGSAARLVWTSKLIVNSRGRRSQ
ncbi:putative membrane protein [Burkholderia pseudomallei]|nr:putative membrane protein [Burkholderia pseudomallei]KGV20531.1 putative membrane protein [Burkholderia pseudomallei TSV 43]KGV31988.1 putative membrane protein [Burkholderia pseudomallei TSV 31]